MKTLFLTLDARPFYVMVSGEKKLEFRMDTSWIRKRLFDKDGKVKDYDQIKFTNGYGADKPWFTCKWTGIVKVWNGEPVKTHFSNGLNVAMVPGMYVIELGEIIEIGNYESSSIGQKQVDPF